MLLDDREIQHEGASRALGLWMAGVGLWALLGLTRRAVSWLAFSSSFDAYDTITVVFTVLQVGGVVAAVLIARGAWRYVQATAPRPLLQSAAGVLALDALISVVYLVLSLVADGSSAAEREMVFTVLGHVWRVVSFLRVGALVLFFTHMARLSESLGSPIAPARVWAAIGVTGLWGALIAASSLDLVPHGGAGMVISAAMTLAVAGATLAVFRPHRAHLRGGASASSASKPEMAPGLEAAGRGLGTYHGAIVAQIVWLVLGNGLTFAVAKSGDRSGTESMMAVVPIVALIIQGFAIAGLVRFARHLPDLHAAKGSAGFAVGAQLLNAVLGLVTVGLVLRALESGRLRYLFDLQDQLPVLQGFGALVGCVAALALLTALARVGAERDVAGLKVAIPVLGGLALLFHLLDPRDLGGPMLLAFAVALLVGAVIVVARFLGVVRRTADAMRMGMP